jgi:transcriptional regulator with XRE-family HTH domain
LTVEDVAKNCGISRSYITLIENGKRAPGKKILVKIALALKVKTVVVLDWYLDGLREELQKTSPFQIS